MGTVAARVAEVADRVAAAAARAGRSRDEITVVAATKTVDPARAAEAVAAGIRDLGENRVQEALTKQAAIAGSEVTWHLIGHLQTNKAARAADAFAAVHSVDSTRVAAALSQRRDPALPPLRVLVEVELTGIPTRTGVQPEALAALLEEIAGLPRLRLEGFMTMAPPTPEADGARPYFARLRELRDAAATRLGAPLPHLSMGMSGDFEVAVEEGATLVRLGRAIFGARG